MCAACSRSFHQDSHLLPVCACLWWVCGSQQCKHACSVDHGWLMGSHAQATHPLLTQRVSQQHTVRYITTDTPLRGQILLPLPCPWLAAKPQGTNSNRAATYPPVGRPRQAPPALSDNLSLAGSQTSIAWGEGLTQTCHTACVCDLTFSALTGRKNFHSWLAIDPKSD